MKLTEDQVKEITAKVHKDLNLTHSNKYPIEFIYIYKNDEHNRFGIDYWSTGYDYRDPEAVGDEINYGEFPEYIISIDDEKGEAFAYHYYTGHIRIKLNEKGNYEVVGKLYDYSKLGK
jgi:hypothetical protein